LKTNWQPSKLSVVNGAIAAVEFEETKEANGNLSSTGEKLAIPCDQLLLAIGQKFDSQNSLDGLSISNGRLSVNPQGLTSHQNVWAGGDCVDGGDDLTVSAVQAGKVAAESIHEAVEA